MEFGPRETKMHIGRLEDGKIRVALEHTRLKITTEGTADTSDEAKAIAEAALKVKVQEALSKAKTLVRESA
jgi:hypothetical protein